jgi:hypothetical protein
MWKGYPFSVNHQKNVESFFPYAISTLTTILVQDPKLPRSTFPKLPSCPSCPSCQKSKPLRKPFLNPTTNRSKKDFLGPSNGPESSGRGGLQTSRESTKAVRQKAAAAAVAAVRMVGFLTTDHRPRTTDHGQQTTDQGPREPNVIAPIQGPSSGPSIPLAGTQVNLGSARWVRCPKLGFFRHKKEKSVGAEAVPGWNVGTWRRSPDLHPQS